MATETTGTLSDDRFRERLLEVIDEAIARETDSLRGAAGPGVRVQVTTGDAGREAASASRVFLRPLANPLSLGFLGLFFATILLTALQLGWVPVTYGHTLATAILVFTVPLQLISCLFGFLTRDMVAATGMGVESGIWAATALTMLHSKPGSTSPALALILIMGAAAVCMPAIGAARGKALAALVLFTTSARWAATGAYEFAATPLSKTIAGAIGLALAVVALYASLAFELEDQQRRTILPTLRRNSGATAMTGDLAAQVGSVANEAGVRKQL